MRSGALQPRFWRVPERSGEGFGGPKALFFEVFAWFLHGLACSGARMARMLRPLQNTGRSGTKHTSERVGHRARDAKNKQKSAQQLPGQRFLLRAHDNEVLERSGADFCQVWTSPGRLFDSNLGGSAPHGTVDMSGDARCAAGGRASLKDLRWGERTGDRQPSPCNPPPASKRDVSREPSGKDRWGKVGSAALVARSSVRWGGAAEARASTRGRDPTREA